MGYRLGVDLGTTWTAAVASTDGGPGEAVDLGGGSSIAMPSVVALDGATVLVGEDAERRLLAAPTSGAREPKRRLGDETPFVLTGTPYSAEALMGHLLANAVRVATESLGAAPEAVVLTHPATWSAYKLDLLREVARSAGLDEVTFVAEPVAAAAHYAAQGKVAADATVAVYDFGGGTFDVAVVRGDADGFGLIGTPEGLERLGGVDLDQAVLAHVDLSLGGALRSSDRDDPAVRQGLARLRDECVRAKESLSADTEVTIAVDLPGLATEVRLTRVEFETAIRPRIAETVEALGRAVAAAGVALDQVDSIVLVGGSSRIPLVAELLAQTGRPVATDVDPKLAVAGGAVAPSITVPSGVDADTTTASAAAAPVPGAAAGAAGAKGGGGGGDRAASGRARIVKTAVGVGVAAGVVAAGSGAAFAYTQQDHGDDDGAIADPFTDPGDDDDTNIDAFDEPDRSATPAHEPTDRPDGPDGTSAPHAPAHSGAGHSGGAGGGASGGGAPRSSSGPRSAPSSRGDDGPDDGPARSARPASEHHDPIAAHRDAQVDMPGAPADAGAPGSQAPAPPMAPSAMTSSAPDGSDRLEAFKDQMRERLEKWVPPKGADAEEVAELRDELEGKIDRFQPAPGQSFEDATGDIRQDLDDSISDFAQSEQIEALQNEEQREAAEERQDLADKREFVEFQQSLAKYVNGWEPAWEGWVTENDELLKKRLVAEATTGASFDPDRDLRAQQLALEASVKNQLEAWQQDQYDQQYKRQLDALTEERNAILANPGTDPEDLDARLRGVQTRQELLNGIYKGLKENPPNKGNEAADAALKAEIEPPPSVRLESAIGLNTSLTSAMVTEALDDDGPSTVARAAITDLKVSSFAEAADGTTIAAATPARSGLVDMFDEVATTPTASVLASLSSDTTAPVPEVPTMRTMSSPAPAGADPASTGAEPTAMPTDGPPPMGDAPDMMSDITMATTTGIAAPGAAGGSDQTPAGAQTLGAPPVDPAADAPDAPLVAGAAPAPAPAGMLSDPIFGDEATTPPAAVPVGDVAVPEAPEVPEPSPAAPAAANLLDDDVLGADAAQTPVAAPATPAAPPGAAATAIPDVAAAATSVPGVPDPDQPGAEDPFAAMPAIPEPDAVGPMLDTDGDGIPDERDQLDDIVP